VKNYLAICEKTTSHEQLCDFFLTRDEYDLAPSAIAIHPITEQLFITSSVGKVLMVLNPDGRIDHLQRLDKKLYAQPEGMTFDSDGTLYISTEKKKSASALSDGYAPEVAASKCGPLGRLAPKTKPARRTS
jgi:uncharacterized protein YjiK